MTTVRTDEKGFSNLGRLVTLVRASARRPPRCRVRSRKVRTATSMCPRRCARVHERFRAPGLFPALGLTAIPRTRPHVSRRFQVHAAGAAGVAPDADACVGARLPRVLPRPPASASGAARAARRALPERARRRPGGVVSFSPQNRPAAFRFLLSKTPSSSSRYNQTSPTDAPPVPRIATRSQTCAILFLVGCVFSRAPARGVLRREPKRRGGGRALRRRMFRRGSSPTTPGRFARANKRRGH